MSPTGERDGDLATLIQPPLLGLLRGDKQALPELYRIVLDVCLILEAKKAKRPSSIGQLRAGWVAAQVMHDVCLFGESGARTFLWTAWKAALADLLGRIETPPGHRILRVGRLFLPRKAYRHLEERVADWREDEFESLAWGEKWRARLLRLVHVVIIVTDPLRSILAWLSRGWRTD